MSRSNQFNARVILAPSATGKTTYVQSGVSGDRVVDGDDVIRDTVGWPKGKWWLTPEAPSFHARNKLALSLYVERHPTRIVLFNGQWPGDVTHLGAVVLPPLEVLVRHGELRAVRRPGTVQPTEALVLERNLSALRDLARTFNILTFDTIQGAVDSILHRMVNQPRW